MVAPKATRHFLGKVTELFRDELTPERQRSGVVQAAFRQNSGVAQVIAHAGSAATLVSRLKKALGSVICPKIIVRPGAACAFWQFRFRRQP